MRRKEKRKKKMLARRCFGHGDPKNRRGAGNRGGRGNAGIAKHKGTWAETYAPGYFGKHGFVPPRSYDVPVLHLYEIDQRALNGTLEKKGDRYVIEFAGKILATGMLRVPAAIKARAWSKRCEEKVKNAGGTLEKLEK